MKLRIVNRPHSLRIRAWRNAGFPLSSLSYCSLSTMLLCADQDGETSPGLVCGPLVISGSRPRLRRAGRHTGSAGHRGLAARHRRLATGHRLLVGDRFLAAGHTHMRLVEGHSDGGLAGGRSHNCLAGGHSHNRLVRRHSHNRLVRPSARLKASEGDFLRAVAEAVLQLLMEADQAPGERSEFCRKPAI